MKKNRSIKQVNEVVNFETGEVTQREMVYNVESEPDFVKFYVKDISLLMGLNKNGYEVLLKCLELLTYKGQIILLAFQRKEIAQSLGITDRTVKNQLAILTSKKIFKRLSNMVYMANPNLFGRGFWSDVTAKRNEFELVIEYKSKKRVIKGYSKSSQKLKAVD